MNNKEIIDTDGESYLVLEIPGHPDYYAECIFGRIWSEKTHRFLKPQLNDDGYHQVHLSHEGIKQWRKVHQLIIESVYGIYDHTKLEPDHIDKDRTNNCLLNLELVTQAEDLKRRGIDKAVLAYRNDIFIGRYESIREAARQLHLNNSSIGDVLHQRYSQTGNYTFKYA